MHPKLPKVSAKYAFHTLREYGPYYCDSLQSEVFINREYWNHLVFQKKRDPDEFTERLFTVSLIKEILKTGGITETRPSHVRIEKSIENIPIGIIVKKQNNKYILLSSFIVYENYIYKKK